MRGVHQHFGDFLYVSQQPMRNSGTQARFYADAVLRRRGFTQTRLCEVFITQTRFTETRFYGDAVLRKLGFTLHTINTHT